MELFCVLYIFFFSFTVVQGTARYSFNGQGLSGCTVASPPIYYTENGTFVNLSRRDIDDISGVVKENAVFRIGYIQQYFVFSYKGCALSHEMNFTRYQDIRNNVGRCYSLCRTDIVGLQENTCHCLSDVPRNTSLFQNGCNTACSSETNFLCGGSNMVSLYMKVQRLEYLSHNQQQSGNCLDFEQRQGWSQYVWAECSLPYLIVCQEDHLIKNTQTYSSWASGLRTCLKESLLLLNNNNSTQKLPHQGVQMWTGYIRSLSMIPSTDGMYNSKQYVQGYVKVSRGNFQLTFGRGNVTMNTICNLGTTPTTYGQHSSPNKTPLYMYISSSTDIVQTSPTTYEQHTSPNKTPLYMYISSSTDIVQTSSSGESKHDGDSTENRSYTVILYTVIPVSLVIILGVVGFILWRRGSIPICRRTDGDFDEKMSTTTANTKLESEPYSDKQIHDYFVLEPQDSYETVKNVNKHERTEDDYDRASRFIYDRGLSVTVISAEDFKKDDYDTTMTVSKPLRDASPVSSIYNRLDNGAIYNRLDNGDTYNHIGEVKGVTAKSDDTYNHLEPKTNEIMYDSTTTISKPIVVADYGDDMYSKVLKKK